MAGKWEQGITHERPERRSDVIKVFLDNWGVYNGDAIDNSDSPRRTSCLKELDEVSVFNGRGKVGLEARVHGLLDQSGLFSDEIESKM